MESAGDWCLIESDPGVFTLLLKKFGAKGVQVEELWTIEDSIFENLRPVHGLIFLFKFSQEDEPSGPEVTDSRLDKIYFAKQVINNACATQAVISLLLNCNHPDVDIGPELTKLKEFSMSFDPKMRGLTLSNSQTIRAAHNSMSQQALFEFDPKIASKDDEAYHFIGYMPIDGRLYELDGLREGPIDHGAIAPEQDWLDVVRPIIMKRISVYTEGEIHFNLMALVSDRKMIYERQLEERLREVQLLGMETDEVDNEIPRLRMLVDYEDVKMARYKQEMARRRHNYLPFIVNLLKILAEEKKLLPLLEKARERVARKDLNPLDDPLEGNSLQSLMADNEPLPLITPDVTDIGTTSIGQSSHAQVSNPIELIGPDLSQMALPDISGMSIPDLSEMALSDLSDMALTDLTQLADDNETEIIGRNLTSAMLPGTSSQSNETRLVATDETEMIDVVNTDSMLLEHDSIDANDILIDDDMLELPDNFDDFTDMI